MGWGERAARNVVALAATIALALQLALPMPEMARAATNAAFICHSDATAPRHDNKQSMPSGQAGNGWCMLCGKLGTAVGPLDRIASLPQRIAAPIVAFAAPVDFENCIINQRAGPVGARAPPEIA